jgi:hypothetical protein
MIVLPIPIPLQTFNKGITNSPFLDFLTDPQSAPGGVFSTLLFIEATDPTGPRVVSAVSAECVMNLINELERQIQVCFLACVMIKPKKIAHPEGIRP